MVTWGLSTVVSQPDADSRGVCGGQQLTSDSEARGKNLSMGIIDMANLLPEVRLGDREGEPEKLLPRRPHCITDIWLWLHCFGTYVSVLGSSFPEAVPELMGYMSLIIRCCQDYEGLAWVHYDMAFCQQAAASVNRKWLEVSSTLYSIYFTGKFRGNHQCDLCLVKTHGTSSYPQYGEGVDGHPLSADADRGQYGVPM